MELSCRSYLSLEQEEVCEVSGMNKVIGIAAIGAVLIFAAKAFTGGIPWIETMANAKSLNVQRTKVMTSNSVSPVVVELFTSEGCSSCPPADRVLSSLRGDKSLGKAGVIILSEHVDYWNRLGWRDRWSDSKFSERQSEYANRLHLDSVYTPQMVVDGQAEFVGSDSRRAADTIANAAKSAKVGVTLEAADAANGQVSLKAHVDRLPAGAEPADVIVAVTEDGLQSHVTSGENSGNTLVHNGVVHTLDSIGQVKGASSFDGKTLVKLGSDWHRNKLTAVAFVQFRQSRKIIGAAAVPL